jgi:hypothetical protein
MTPLTNTQFDMDYEMRDRITIAEGTMSVSKDKPFEITASLPIKVECYKSFYCSDIFVTFPNEMYSFFEEPYDDDNFKSKVIQLLIEKGGLEDGKYELYRAELGMQEGGVAAFEGLTKGGKPIARAFIESHGAIDQSRLDDDKHEKERQERLSSIKTREDLIEEAMRTLAHTGTKCVEEAYHNMIKDRINNLSEKELKEIAFSSFISRINNCGHSEFESAVEEILKLKEEDELWRIIRLLDKK